MTTIVKLSVIAWFAFSSIVAVAAELDWNTLDEQTQKVLTPFENEWDGLDQATKRKLFDQAQRWSEASSEERTQAAERFARWQSLEAPQRDELRQRFRWFREQTPKRQRELRRVFQRFRHLPRDERRQLMRRFEAMTPEQRQGFVQGLRMNDRATGMRRFLDQFTQQERVQIRRIDAGLSQEQRMIFRHRMRGAAKSERGKLMRQWLQMSDEERLEYLRPR